MKRKAMLGAGAIGLVALGAVLGPFVFFTVLGRQMKRR